jgi:glycosyltransferase involved in cell wall biosynthesis
MTAEPCPVIFALSRSEVGGTQRELGLLLRALDRRAFPPHVLLGEDGPFAGTLRSLDVSFEVSPAPMRSLKGAKHFARAATRHRSRILHLCAPRTLAIAARGIGLAVVEVVNLMRSKEAGGWVARPFLDRALMKLAHAAIVPSRAMRDQLVARGIPEKKLFLVEDGIPLEEPARPREQVRASLAIPGDALAILSVGRLVPVKGHDVLLRAFAGARASLPGSVLFVAGEGEERPRLETLAKELGLGEAVRFLGDRDDVRDLLSASDLVVQASRSESLGLAVLEAAAASRAVLATDVGGHKETVLPGVTGVLVPPEDPSLLARAIVELGKEPARREALGRAARARVEKERSVEAMARAVEAVYREALRRAGHHG